MSDAHALVRLAQDTDRARRACDRMAVLGRSIEGAVRRAMPWLSRRRVEVTTLTPQTSLFGDILSTFPLPHHIAPLRIDGRHDAALVLDSLAIARCVDGVLAGGGGELPQLDPGGLTAAQSALATRLAQGLIGAIAEATGRAGLPLEPNPDASATRGGLFVTCTVALGPPESAGHISLLVAAGALESSSHLKALPPKGMPPATLSGVEVDVIAELGRVPMALSRLASLRVGDFLRLNLPVEGTAQILVGGNRVFSGRPTMRGNQIAVEITDDRKAS